jgi:hypothetical protein
LYDTSYNNLIHSLLSSTSSFVRIFIEIMLARAPGAVEKNWQSAQRNDCCLHATVSQEATFPAVIGRFAISVDFE